VTNAIIWMQTDYQITFKWAINKKEKTVHVRWSFALIVPHSRGLKMDAAVKIILLFLGFGELLNHLFF